jgi:ribonuclease HII
MVLAEAPYRERGIRRLAGVDEVGVGPLAGPVVAAAVIMGEEHTVSGVYDSKGLSESQRWGLVDKIKAHSVCWALGYARPREIDRVNIYQATLLSMRRAVLRLQCTPELVLVDARTIPDIPMAQEAHVKGDARFYHIACASVLAKVYRDGFMERMERLYPGYGFKEHKGYPTKEHRDAIRELGPTRIHRRSFRWLPEGDANQLELEGIL